MKHLFTVAVAILLASSPATSAQWRTDELMWMCQGIAGDDEFSNMMKKIQCIGYIDGFLDMHALSRRVTGSRLFCLPSQGISIDQGMRIFLKWAEEHPESLHETGRVSLLLALSSAFPCDE